METQTLIMLSALFVNFVALVIGVVSLFMVIQRNALHTENRLATMEERIDQLMRQRGMTVRRKIA